MLEEILEKYDLIDEHEIITEITPKGYNVTSQTIELDEVKNYPDKTMITVTGFIDSFSCSAMNGRKALSKISAKIYKDGKSASLSWIVSTLASKKVLFALQKQTEGNALLQVTGKVTSFNAPHSGTRIVSLDSPKIQAIGDTAEVINGDFVVPEPMYVLRDEMSYFKLKMGIKWILKNIDPIKEKLGDKFLPIELEKQFELQPLVKSLEYLHGLKPIPANKFEDFLNYPGFNRRVSAEKIWEIILSSYKSQRNSEKSDLVFDRSDLETLKSSLPFELTTDQLSTMNGLLEVFEKEWGTKSLVFGDVGSGKTMVAMFISYALYLKGFQVAIITPTSILTKQHYEEFVKFLKADVFIVHSKTKAKEKVEINNFLASGRPAIVLGTTSANSLSFTNLGAVFIDEEQKLGVYSKEKLVNQFNKRPHLIYMTATPIPRTLAASIYTNFYVFQIKTKPKNRLPRETQVVDFAPDLTNIKSRLGEEQALVIIPSIDGTDLMSVKTAKNKYDKLLGVECQAIHGRMDKKEVESIIEKYMNGEFPVLIATTMVDSGFSNASLSFVFVENADRFGISQLHQIRGRCGRGKYQGHCYLVPTSFKGLKDKTLTRLKKICETEDGFELSEFDLKSRGSGDLKSDEQAGTEMNLVEWVKEIEIMKDYIKNNLS